MEIVFRVPVFKRVKLIESKKIHFYLSGNITQYKNSLDRILFVQNEKHSGLQPKQESPHLIDTDMRGPGQTNGNQIKKQTTNNLQLAECYTTTARKRFSISSRRREGEGEHKRETNVDHPFNENLIVYFTLPPTCNDPALYVPKRRENLQSKMFQREIAKNRYHVLTYLSLAAISATTR